MTKTPALLLHLNLVLSAACAAGSLSAPAAPVDALGRPKIVKLCTIDCDLVESTPIVFQSQLYGCEWVRTTYAGNQLKQDHFRLVDHDRGKATDPFAHGFLFASAYVESNTVYVTGTHKSAQGDHIEMFASRDLKTWDSWTVFEQPGFGLFNTTLCKAENGYVPIKKCRPSNHTKLSGQLGVPRPVSKHEFVSKASVFASGLAVHRSLCCVNGVDPLPDL